MNKKLDIVKKCKGNLLNKNLEIISDCYHQSKRSEDSEVLQPAKRRRDPHNLQYLLHMTLGWSRYEDCKNIPLHDT